MSNEIIFLPEDEVETESLQTWKVLVVDDEDAVHVITKNAIKDIQVYNRKLEIYSAKSAMKAKEILAEHDDIALAIIDVVMETPTAGLDLVNYIRNDLKNKIIRLVIRTGQASEAPEQDVIENYDINDYKEKTELTTQKLFTMIRSTITQYEQIIQLEDKYEQTYKKMTTHQISGLPNRIKLNEVLDTGREKSIILLNIDGFSLINDSQGFTAGNELLKKFAKFLYEKFNNIADAFHLEGDSFILLYKEVYSDQCRDNKIDDIRSCINDELFVIDGLKMRITVTIGFACDEIGNLIQKVELALKQAKSNGYEYVQKYSKDMKIIKHVEDTLVWKTRLHDAVLNDRLLSYYQPIVDLKTDEIIKYETLVRLEYDGKIYTPNYFLDAAKCSGQLFDIFNIMFINVCKMIQTSGASFSINIDKSDLMEARLFDIIEKNMRKYNISKGRITLEILENKSLIDNTKVHELLHKLREIGLLIAIDDFGANCSNYAQITDVEVDYIKIDGQFIADLNTNEKSKIVTKTIVDFAKKLNIPTISEFVHSKEIHEIVKDMGIDYGQGYYYSEPTSSI